MQLLPPNITALDARVVRQPPLELLEPLEPEDPLELEEPEEPEEVEVPELLDEVVPELEPELPIVSPELLLEVPELLLLVPPELPLVPPELPEEPPSGTGSISRPDLPPQAGAATITTAARPTARKRMVCTTHRIRKRRARPCPPCSQRSDGSENRGSMGHDTLVTSGTDL
jgi:hypothetical protein